MKGKNESGRSIVIVLISHRSQIITGLSIHKRWCSYPLRSWSITSRRSTVTDTIKRSDSLSIQQQLMDEKRHLPTTHSGFWAQCVLRKNRVVVYKGNVWLIPLLSSTSLFNLYLKCFQRYLQSLSYRHSLIWTKRPIWISFDNSLLFRIADIPCIPVFLIHIWKTALYLIFLIIQWLQDDL